MKKNGYVSEFTNFINEFIAKKPDIKTKQRELRATWWDKKREDIAFEEQLEKNDLPRQGYEYFSYNTKISKG